MERRKNEEREVQSRSPGFLPLYFHGYIMHYNYELAVYKFN